MPLSPNTHLVLLQIIGKYYKCAINQLLLIKVQLLTKMDHLTPSWHPRGDPSSPTPKILVPNCHQVDGNLVPINGCGLKCKLSQFRWIIFHILLKMAPLNPVFTPRGTPFPLSLILRIKFRGLKWNWIKYWWKWAISPSSWPLLGYLAHSWCLYIQIVGGNEIKKYRNSKSKSFIFVI